MQPSRNLTQPERRRFTVAMNFRASRLKLGDWLLGLSSLALLIVLFAFPWFAVSGNFAKVAAAGGAIVSANGWQTFTVIGPLTVLVALLGIAAWTLQATSARPAPAVLTTIVLAPFSLLLLIWLILRVLIFPPQLQVGVGATGNVLVGKPAAYVAIVLSLLLVVGVWLSLRRDAVDPADAPQQIELVPLG